MLASPSPLSSEFKLQNDPAPKSIIFFVSAMGSDPVANFVGFRPTFVIRRLSVSGSHFLDDTKTSGSTNEQSIICREAPFHSWLLFVHTAGV